MNKKVKAAAQASKQKDRIVFYLILLERGRSEKSSYARFLFQENIIATFINSTLHTIASVINGKMMEMNFKKDRSIALERAFKIKFNDKDLTKKTLGQLSQVLNPYLTQEQELRSSLKDFVSLRNRLTHKMFEDYQSMTQLEEDSARLVIIGEKVITNLQAFLNRLLDREFGEK